MTNEHRRDVITVLRDPSRPIGKAFSQNADGSLKKTAVVAVSKVLAKMVYVPDHVALAKLLREVGGDQHAAIIPDRFKGIDIGEEFLILPEAEIERLIEKVGREHTAGVHSLEIDGRLRKVTGRLKENILPGCWKVLDRDVDHHTPKHFAEKTFEQWLCDVNTILPGVAAAALVRSPSASARVFKAGQPVGAGNGHVWIKLRQADDAERCRTAIVVRSAARGLTWSKPRFSRASGAICGHSLTTVLDPSVFTPGRIVFVGKPVVGVGLTVGALNVEVIDEVGDDDVDTSLTTLPDATRIREITKAAGCELRVRSDGSSLRCDAFDLRLDSILETESHGEMPVAEAMRVAKPMRCQAPFRDSRSMAGKFGFSVDGRPFIHDVGTATNHWLADADWAPIREKMIGDEFEPVVLTAAEVKESEAAAARNAKRQMPVVFESQRDRSKRIASEGSHVAPTQRIMTGTEMLAELVYIADGARVAFLNYPRFVLPFGEFKNFTAGSVDFRKTGDGSKGAKFPLMQKWVESPDRKTVRTQTFAPGRGVICRSPAGDEALNLWVPRSEVPPDNWREYWRRFVDHVEYLIPQEVQRERFLDWLAHTEQCPGVLPHTHYLMVAKQTGIGRNWLAYALARVWSGNVALGFDLGESLRTGFNGALSQRVLAVVDELHAGGPGGSNKASAEKLKSMLTEATRLVNPKYGRQHEEYNCCRFLMFSNHEAALPLADNDRRVVVIANPNERLDPGYYKDLYALLDLAGFGPAIAEGLKLREISHFNPGEVAPASEAKDRTIRAGRTEVEQAVRDLASEWPSDCITSGRLHDAITSALGIDVRSTQSACVAAGLAKFDSRVRVAGTPSHIWILRNREKWAHAAPALVAAEVLRGCDVLVEPEEFG